MGLAGGQAGWLAGLVEAWLVLASDGFLGSGAAWRFCAGVTDLKYKRGGPAPALLALAAGAGKTTLLNTLAGKAQAYGTQAGSIFVNGRPDRLERYKRVMGFVPQVGGHS